MTPIADTLLEQQQFMAEHPVMDPPSGWRLAPEKIAPEMADEDNPAEGWFLLDAAGEVRHQVAELPNGAEQSVVRRLAESDPEAVTIELWRNHGKIDAGLWWAAVRINSANV